MGHVVEDAVCGHPNHSLHVIGRFAPLAYEPIGIVAGAFRRTPVGRLAFMEHIQHHDLERLAAGHRHIDYRVLFDFTALPDQADLGTMNARPFLPTQDNRNKEVLAVGIGVLLLENDGVGRKQFLFTNRHGAQLLAASRTYRGVLQLVSAEFLLANRILAEEKVFARPRAHTLRQGQLDAGFIGDPDIHGERQSQRRQEHQADDYEVGSKNFCFHRDHTS